MFDICTEFERWLFLYNNIIIFVDNFHCTFDSYHPYNLPVAFYIFGFGLYIVRHYVCVYAS